MYRHTIAKQGVRNGEAIDIDLATKHAQEQNFKKEAAEIKPARTTRNNGWKRKADGKK